ncbi:hypothetical protein [Alkalibacter mobilis]|uniref:hypothetical protein n=1 Tax=Alkalibacter mobilis TaxID=2787712 RepID=UPI00189C72E2|nr:hypothetical protein [Alkalibacter mobilis]MBF7097799.1 hypothetical protein [Alkalibacter mobilis]
MINIDNHSELGSIPNAIPVDVRTETSKLIDLLDENFGADRDIIRDLGGFLILKGNLGQGSIT